MLLKKPETPQFFSDSLLNSSNSKQQTGEKIKGKTTSCVVLYLPADQRQSAMSFILWVSGKLLDYVRKSSDLV